RYAAGGARREKATKEAAEKADGSLATASARTGARSFGDPDLVGPHHRSSSAESDGRSLRHRRIGPDLGLPKAGAVPPPTDSDVSRPRDDRAKPANHRPRDGWP